MLKTLKELCSLNGVSGCEDEVRTYIKSRVSPFARDIREDAFGNLIVFKKGRKRAAPIIALSAHMDEVGVIIRSITADGYLKFRFVGGVDRRVMLGQRVYFGRERIPGVIGVKAYHMVSKDEEKKVPKVEDLYIDIGAENKEEAEKMVSVGDYGAFSDKTALFGNGYIKAKAIDDRIGCAVMIKLIENTPPVDCYFCFNAQEEVGARGAHASTYSVSPDIALVLEGTTAADIPSVPENKRICFTGNGPVIPFMDNGTIYDRGLFDLILNIAERENIPYQLKKYVSGGTDASSIQRSKEGVKTAAIAAPVRYIHSPFGVASIKDFDAMLTLTEKFLESWEAKDA